MSNYCCIVLISFLLIFAENIFGQSEISAIGRVTKIRGEVIRTNSESETSDLLSVGSKVFETDELNSGNKSYLKLLMVDDTVIQLGPNSQLNLETFGKDSKKGRIAIYQLTKGQFRSLFVTKSKKEMVIKTPSASMGVRGTKTIQIVSLEGDFHSCLEGKCSLERPRSDGTVDKFDLEEGGYLSISANDLKLDSLKEKIEKYPTDVLQELKKKDELLIPRIDNLKFEFDANKRFRDLKQKKEKDLKEQKDKKQVQNKKSRKRAKKLTRGKKSAKRVKKSLLIKKKHKEDEFTPEQKKKLKQKTGSIRAKTKKIVEKKTRINNFKKAKKRFIRRKIVKPLPPKPVATVAPKPALPSTN